jgi:hypothetical protein
MADKPQGSTKKPAKPKLGRVTKMEKVFSPKLAANHNETLVTR